MSHYKNFVQNFPSRCRKLLRQKESNFDLEVTQLIMVASGGLIIPRERLKSRHGTDHPDVSKYPELAQSLQTEQERLLRDSSFWPLIQGSARYMKKYRPAGIELSAEEDIPLDMTLEKFLDVIRNGLSHGNIFVAGPSEQIASLTFGQTERGKRNTDHYEYVTLSVQDFRALLMQWFDLLVKESLTIGTIPTLEAAD